MFLLVPAPDAPSLPYDAGDVFACLCVSFSCNNIRKTITQSRVARQHIYISCKPRARCCYKLGLTSQQVRPSKERLRLAIEYWPAGSKHVHARKLFAAHPMVCPDSLGRRVAERSKTSDYV